MINQQLYSEISNITKRIALLIVSIILSITGTFAQKVYLRVTDHHDNSSIFIVDENLDIETDGTNILIHSSDSDVSMNISDFKRFSYESDIVTAISNISTPHLTVEINNENIKIDYQDDRSHTYHIVDLNGSEITQATFTGMEIISMDTFCNGVYVMKIDNFPSIKLLVK